MPSLLIRDLPEHIYKTLAVKADRNHRSLEQQATLELEIALETQISTPRLETVAALREALKTEGNRETRLDPVDSIRAFRER